VDLQPLSGQRLVVDHAGRHRLLLVLEDDRYTYAFQIEAPTPSYDELLYAVVGSMCPIPQPARDAEAAMSPWID
jgi:hypothetical protein